MGKSFIFKGNRGFLAFPKAILNVMFPEYDKLLRLYLTIPVTTASAERAFSTLNRLKTCLRSSIGQARLNRCLIGHIYKMKLDKIDSVTIAALFVKANTR